MSSSRKTSSFDRPRSPILTLGLSLTSMGFLLTPSAFTVQAKNGQCTGGAQRVPREARPVCNHPIQHIWRKLGEQVYGYLDSLEVLWSTIDPVRFAEQGGKPGPLYLWVGVNPGSLSLEVAKAAATGCKEILAAAKFPDIGIAFRESILTRSAGPQFLDHIPPGTPTADIRSPFTGALGVPIAPRNSPHFEGTGALYICEGDQAERVFLLTARHVVLPPRLYSNELYEHKVTNEPPQEVLILGAGAYERATNDMKNEVANQATCVEIYTKRLARLGNPAVGENPVVTMARRRDTGVLEDAKEAGLAINNLYSRVAKDWTSPALRVLGHVVYAPPISVGTGPKEFTEDWALIELNRDKINWDNFKGNVVYLGDKIPPADLFSKMNPHKDSPHPFRYPDDGLLRVQGVVKEQEIRHPTSLDKNGESCLIVIKNGRTTGVTVGRATSIESFVRRSDYGIRSTSIEIAIHSYDHKSGAFSADGDSGSIVVDGMGRIIGLITGASGAFDSKDVSYVTPYFWLEERIKKAFPASHLYPTRE